MPRFCVNRNAQPTGEHEVHNLDAKCIRFPDPINQHYLGVFTHCSGALAEARKTYRNVDGCYYCVPECHKK